MNKQVLSAIALTLVIAVFVYLILCFLSPITTASDSVDAKKFDAVCVSYKENRCINLKGVYHVESVDGYDTLKVIVPNSHYYKGTTYLVPKKLTI